MPFVAICEACGAREDMARRDAGAPWPHCLVCRQPLAVYRRPAGTSHSAGKVAAPEEGAR